MSDKIKCSQNDCNEDAVAKFHLVGFEDTFHCEHHWNRYKAVFCGEMGNPIPITETVNGAHKLTPEEAEIYNKAISGRMEE